ncbi:hypothetical protein [Bacillus cereus]|uniref:hypothetical protein n=1 Tax=Bacillus cereus TaxID=1396 RepID=UPI000BEDF6CA|nr:hypothetical protein [Bacillus cereus]PEA06359.1 hypothetical protein CON37_01855 [Bacillus cereus]
MKTSIEKTFKRTLIASAALMGILVSGGNSASAYDTPIKESEYMAPFKDVNGTPVFLKKEYYMEPVDFPGHGLKYEQWSTNEWAKLGPERGMTVTFENVLYNPLGTSIVKIKTDRYDIEFSMGGSVNVAKRHYKYLGAGLDAEGVELRRFMSDSEAQYWEPIQSANPELASTNTIAFKNEEKNKFLSYRNSNEWLNVNQPTINSKTKWRLIPKQ